MSVYRSPFVRSYLQLFIYLLYICFLLFLPYRTFMRFTRVSSQTHHCRDLCIIWRVICNYFVSAFSLSLSHSIYIYIYIYRDNWLFILSTALLFDTLISRSTCPCVSHVAECTLLFASINHTTVKPQFTFHTFTIIFHHLFIALLPFHFTFFAAAKWTCSPPLNQLLLCTLTLSNSLHMFFALSLSHSLHLTCCWSFYFRTSPMYMVALHRLLDCLVYSYPICIVIYYIYISFLHFISFAYPPLILITFNDTLTFTGKCLSQSPLDTRSLSPCVPREPALHSTLNGRYRERERRTHRPWVMYLFLSLKHWNEKCRSLSCIVFKCNATFNHTYNLIFSYSICLI